MKNHLLLLPILTLLTACGGDDDKNPTTVTPPTGGPGGDATLRITPRHHAKTIDSCTVYIKYNTSDMPSAYDDSARVMITGNDTVAVFSGLKKGNYYLYGRGYDPGIFEAVDGGAPYTISSETVQSLSLPVTEDH